MELQGYLFFYLGGISARRSGQTAHPEHSPVVGQVPVVASHPCAERQRTAVKKCQERTGRR